jgi:hypothetical protein
MKTQNLPASATPDLPITIHVVTEEVARKRFHGLLDAEHSLGSRRPQGRTLYQVACRGDEWIGLSLWTAAVWHFKSRDQRIGWDPVTRSERLQLVVHQSRFLLLDGARQPNLASNVLAHFLRQVSGQWEECFGYLPLLAETFTDPESHAGTCYKATGWEPVGMSRRDGRHYAEKFPEPLSSKKLWIKPLHPKAFAWLCAPELPDACQAGVAGYAAERSPLRASHLKSLFQTLQTVEDPRSRQARTFPLGAVLSLVALGLLRGAVHLSAMVRQASKLTQNQRRNLRLPFKKGTRFVKVPCYDVFREVLRRVDLEQLAGALTGWMQSHVGELPRTLAIDGKIIRDKLGLIVTLVDTESGAPVAVMADPRGKGHELKAAQKLLASPLVNLKGASLTGDSLHCQDQTAHLITREKGGDYILQIRGNQPTLEAFAQGQLASAPPFSPKPTAATEGSMIANSAPCPPMPKPAIFQRRANS